MADSTVGKGSTVRLQKLKRFSEYNGEIVKVVQHESEKKTLCRVSNGAVISVNRWQCLSVDTPDVSFSGDMSTFRETIAVAGSSENIVLTDDGKLAVQSGNSLQFIDDLSWVLKSREISKIGGNNQTTRYIAGNAATMAKFRAMVLVAELPYNLTELLVGNHRLVFDEPTQRLLCEKKPVSFVKMSHQQRQLHLMDANGDLMMTIPIPVEDVNAILLDLDTLCRKAGVLHNIEFVRRVVLNDTQSIVLNDGHLYLKDAKAPNESSQLTQFNVDSQKKYVDGGNGITFELPSSNLHEALTDFNMLCLAVGITPNFSLPPVPQETPPKAKEGSEQKEKNDIDIDQKQQQADHHKGRHSSSSSSSSSSSAAAPHPTPQQEVVKLVHRETVPSSVPSYEERAPYYYSDLQQPAPSNVTSSRRSSLSRDLKPPNSENKSKKSSQAGTEPLSQRSRDKKRKEKERKKSNEEYYYQESVSSIPSSAVVKESKRSRNREKPTPVVGSTAPPSLGRANVSHQSLFSPPSSGVSGPVLGGPGRGSQYDSKTRPTSIDDIGFTVNESLIITSVIPGSKASAGGMPPGLKITSVAGRNVRTTEELTEAIRSCSGGKDLMILGEEGFDFESRSRSRRSSAASSKQFTIQSQHTRSYHSKRSSSSSSSSESTSDAGGDSPLPERYPTPVSSVAKKVASSAASTESGTYTPPYASNVTPSMMTSIVSSKKNKKVSALPTTEPSSVTTTPFSRPSNAMPISHASRSSAAAAQPQLSYRSSSSSSSSVKKSTARSNQSKKSKTHRHPSSHSHLSSVVKSKKEPNKNEFKGLPPQKATPLGSSIDVRSVSRRSSSSSSSSDQQKSSLKKSSIFESKASSRQPYRSGTPAISFTTSGTFRSNNNDDKKKKKKSKKTSPLKLGISVDNNMMVTRIEPGSLSEEAGVQTGWVVISIGGQAVNSVEGIDVAFKNWCSTSEKNLEIECRRPGDSDSSSTGGYSSDDDTKPPTASSKKSLKPFGLTVDSNMIITNIASNSRAEKAGLHTGLQVISVRDVDVKTPNELYASLAVDSSEPLNVNVRQVQKNKKASVTSREEQLELQLQAARDEARHWKSVAYSNGGGIESPNNTDIVIYVNYDSLPPSTFRFDSSLLPNNSVLLHDLASRLPPSVFSTNGTPSPVMALSSTDSDCKVSGIYLITPEIWNHAPVWECRAPSNASQAFLFLNDSKKWVICTKREHMARSTGWVKSRRPQERDQMMPNEVTSWVSNDGVSWKVDSSLTCFVLPFINIFSPSKHDWVSITTPEQLTNGSRLLVGDNPDVHLISQPAGAQERASEGIARRAGPAPFVSPPPPSVSAVGVPRTGMRGGGGSASYSTPGPVSGPGVGSVMRYNTSSPQIHPPEIPEWPSEDVFNTSIGIQNRVISPPRPRPTPS